MTRVLFGVTSSPFLLNTTIKHHLKRYVDKFPHTHKLLENNLYVDDVHIGEDNVDKALIVCLESYEIFKDASMYLRKWRTNSPELFHKLKERNLEVDDSPDFYNQTLVSSKVLGVALNPKEDYFYFDTQSLEKFLLKSKDTKRYILQIAGRIFDPIGYIGPYTIRIKCLIQKIWCLGLDWDEIVPDEIIKIFNDWCDDLKKLSNIRITRHYFYGSLPKDIHNIELHLFSDASIKAYETVAYLSVELNDGNIITSFVASKGRVAPLKTLSLPHPELMGALLSARLSEKIMKGLEFPVQRIFWTDSSIVFFWIKGSPDKFKVFIKNRIQEIHKLSNPSEWFHCPGKENPGDIISRGLSVAELENSDFWWQGPSWLREKKSSWPKPLETHKELVTDPETLEIRKTLAVNTVMEDTNQDINNFIKKYSSFTKFIRITAYCLRFLKNCKITQSDRKKDNLSASELQNATHVLIKCAQLSEWSLIQRLRDTFWARWSSEYLNELQRRTKWTDVKENLKVGQLDLLKNASQIPMKWTLARVIKIHPGEDGLVRVVDVKTAKGTFTRAVTNLLPLPGDVGLSPNGGRDVIATKTNCKQKEKFFSSPVA
ncbi:reverse transcriptase domain-containing protein [Trichonephila inaurata madagascariensis]|uniref:Reverse transcriptase domain-containing protein n=1 Tax=Trichonephila inaurata madagascariensis TaxID=2747483 RepID=A0A8X6M6U6_9ARAC|nr:reverse transcriptase domain-containing protein [Trichonephila inaurata madagascariensis]